MQGRFERIVEVAPVFPDDVVEALRIHSARCGEAAPGRPLFDEVEWREVVGQFREPSTGDWIRIMHAVLRRKARREAAGESVERVSRPRTSSTRWIASARRGAASMFPRAGTTCSRGRPGSSPAAPASSDPISCAARSRRATLASSSSTSSPTRETCESLADATEDPPLPLRGSRHRRRGPAIEQIFREHRPIAVAELRGRDPRRPLHRQPRGLRPDQRGGDVQLLEAARHYVSRIEPSRRKALPLPARLHRRGLRLAGEHRGLLGE